MNKDTNFRELLLETYSKPPHLRMTYLANAQKQSGYSENDFWLFLENEWQDINASMQISKDKKFSWRWKDGRYYGLHEKGVEDLKVFLENFWNHIDPEAKETNISSNPELIKQKRIIDLFSEDEKKIAELVVKGKSNKEIAADCFMNEKKVKQLNREMCEKLNLEKTDKKELAKIFTSYLIQ